MNDPSMSDPQPGTAHRDGSFGLGIVRGIGTSGQPVYAGTADQPAVERRRAKSKAARKARRVTRRRSR